MTNLQVEQKLISEIISKAATRMELEDSTVLWLRERPNKSPWNWLVEQSLAQHFTSCVLQKESGSGENFPRLTFAPIILAIAYHSGENGHKDTVARSVTCSVYLQYETKAGVMAFAEAFNAEYKDLIGKEEKTKVENAAYEFTVGPQLPASTFHKIIEPILITLITGGIIYVFYSFRSH